MALSENNQDLPKNNRVEHSPCYKPAFFFCCFFFVCVFFVLFGLILKHNYYLILTFLLSGLLF